MVIFSSMLCCLEIKFKKVTDSVLFFFLFLRSLCHRQCFCCAYNLTPYLLPDFFLNFGLSFQVKRICSQQFDSLLLSPGSVLLLLQQHLGEALWQRNQNDSVTKHSIFHIDAFKHHHLHLPRSPLSRASARGGFRSLSNDSSCGFASNMSRSKAGLSNPWGERAEPGVVVAGGGRDWVPLGTWAWCCLFWPEEVPGTAMELKSMRGRPKTLRLIMINAKISSR